MNKLYIKKQLVHLSKHQTYGEYLQTEKKNLIWIICCKWFAYISHFPNGSFYLIQEKKYISRSSCSSQN